MLLGAKQFFERRGAPTPPLPYDAEVEYLESTGTQWIDTGISWDVYSNIGFRVKLNPLASANVDPVVGSFCGYSNWGSRWFGVNYTSLSSRGIQVGLGNSGAYYSGDMSLRDYDIEVSSVRGVWIDGTQIEFSYGSDVSRSGTSFYLFATCARDGSGVNHISPRRCRIYNLTMYDGADVLEELIPVRFTNELGQSEGAMYDRVSGQLFRNAGTGAFTIGPDKTAWTNPYVTDGLVAMWDGEWNAGGGVHSTEKICKNIASDMYHGTVGADVEIGSDYFGFDGVRNISHVISLGDSWFGRPENITCEICFISTGDGSQTTQCCFGGTENRTSGISFVCGTSDSHIHCMTSAYTGSIPSFPSGGLWIKEPARTISFSVGNGINSYLNGQNVYSLSGTYTMDWQQQVYPCYIGSDAYNPTEFTLRGKVFCVRFYSRALTAEEIAANYAVDKARFNLP